MKKQTTAAKHRAPDLDALGVGFDTALAEFAQARRSNPNASSMKVLHQARALLATAGGLEFVYRRVKTFELAGLFGKSDWSQPAILQPALARRSLREGEPVTTVVEALSEIRLLAVASGDYFHHGISAEQARHFLTQVLALNLDLLNGQMTEADRERPADLTQIVHAVYQFLLSRLGYGNILDSLVEEVWRLLLQGPVQVDSIKDMIVQIDKCLFDPNLATQGTARAALLVAALFGPTRGCRDDPGINIYSKRLQRMTPSLLAKEARDFASHMHKTGLVSDYHAVFLRHVRGHHDELLPEALGLSVTGLDALECYQELVYKLMDEAIYPETCQAIYGLARMLERRTLFSTPVTQALWRQIYLKLSPESAQFLHDVFGDAQPPRVFLLAGVLNVLGQPLGVGQGNNPTCQSAIGLSMWAENEADYLLQLLAWAARDNEVLSRFEGNSVSSKSLAPGLAKDRPIDVDPVSLIVVPHLDRIYAEMWRLCEGRDDDPHRWINPEFYGWWVSHGFRVAVDVHTEKLSDYEGFIRTFYAAYHPYYNGHMPVIHPQPAGIAVTDSGGRYVGRHAITILRVAITVDSQMRVYFFNPNNDGGQDWGQDIHCSVHGHGEIRGEVSLPIDEFASRLYAFHYDPLELGDPAIVPEPEVTRALHLGITSWVVDFQ